MAIGMQMDTQREHKRTWRDGKARDQARVPLGALRLMTAEAAANAWYRALMVKVCIY